MNAEDNTVKEESDMENKESFSGPSWWLEEGYEYFRKVPLRLIDIFIYLMIFLLIAVVAIGIIKAKTA